MSKCADFICVGLVSTCISNLRHKKGTSITSTKQQHHLQYLSSSCYSCSYSFLYTYHCHFYHFYLYYFYKKKTTSGTTTSNTSNSTSSSQSSTFLAADINCNFLLKTAISTVCLYALLLLLLLYYYFQMANHLVSLVILYLVSVKTIGNYVYLNYNSYHVQYYKARRYRPMVYFSVCPFIVYNSQWHFLCSVAAVQRLLVQIMSTIISVNRMLDSKIN